MNERTNDSKTPNSISHLGLFFRYACHQISQALLPMPVRSFPFYTHPQNTTSCLESLRCLYSAARFRDGDGNARYMGHPGPVEHHFLFSVVI